MYDMALWKQLKGTGTVNNGAATATIIAAPTTASGQPGTLYLTTIHYSITAAATGGSGVFNLRDGTTVIFSMDANAALSNGRIDFGPRGYPLTNGNLFSISVTGAVTLQATVNVIVTALVAG